MKALSIQEFIDLRNQSRNRYGVELHLHDQCSSQYLSTDGKTIEKEYLRQYRIILVCGLRSKIFRQVGQIISSHTAVWGLIFGQADGIIFKQGARHELCGVALIFLTGFLDDKNLSALISDDRTGVLIIPKGI